MFENGEVIARVGDNGCGIPPENLEKNFEPFFTAKEIGVGTGLGLSIVKDFAEQHGGSLTVKSQVGEGTCFTLRLQIKGK